MKKFTIILLALLAILPAAAKKNKTADGDPKISFAQNVYDFGKVAEKGGAVSHDFQFQNIGDGVLVILDATAECGCTRPDFPKNPIAPGKSGKLKVTYNPIGRPGPFEKTVTVKTNGIPRKVRLKIRGVVN